MREFRLKKWYVEFFVRIKDLIIFHINSLNRFIFISPPLWMLPCEWERETLNKSIIKWNFLDFQSTSHLISKHGIRCFFSLQYIATVQDKSKPKWRWIALCLFREFHKMAKMKMQKAMNSWSLVQIQSRNHENDWLKERLLALKWFLKFESFDNVRRQAVKLDNFKQYKA